ncbi:hypothetical protein N7U66_12110 [Lacinutrix neustonica]|uniref:Lipoprotein n=1 Tax=Lacinutrix neustonica TaxID=2980107 RepID=A0A9E8SFP2_9FLAO|nr:hypothetical protein [Lacinutrix neustonica]WAC00950.1 hypothetical protein N7U66_12110 [Lacinutrix neustonica]
MKSIMYNLVLLIVLSCNSQKTVKEDARLDKTSINSQCPENGSCTFEVLKNKTFFINEKFGNTYPEISEGTKTILKFEYVRNAIPDTQDSSYRELIYVEIDANTEGLKLEDMDLLKAKVSFGRLCFCRDQTGYYAVKEGRLSISKNDDKTYSFKLTFNVSEVPQVITRIEESFTL